MKCLVICNTYYQLIFAIQMKLTVLANDEVSIIITNQSRNSDEVYNRLKEQDIFKDCYYMETKKMCSRKNSIIDNIKDVMIGVFGLKKTTSILTIKYDELFAFNYDLAAYAIFASLKRNNDELICNRFEEGIISYRNVEMRSSKMLSINAIRMLIHKPSLNQSCVNMYCFYPNFYNGSLKTRQVPKINDESDIKNILRKIFEVNIEETPYDRKYIFFTSVYDFEGGKSIGEFDLVCRIANIIGKENLLIKMHPRDTRGIYEREGFSVDPNSSIPWEVIQLCNDFSNKVLLTVNSGSILSSNLMTENGATAFFMYKFCNLGDNPQAEKTVNIINQLLTHEIMMKELIKVRIAAKMEEILV